MVRIILVSLLVALGVSSTYAQCLGMWANTCSATAKCCAGLYCDQPAGWATGLCKQGAGAPAPAPAPAPASGSAPAPVTSGGSQAATTITFAQFSNAVKSANPRFVAPTQAQYKGFMNGLKAGKITSKTEAAMALAQFLHESDGLVWKTEWACSPGGSDPGCQSQYKTPGCDVSPDGYRGRGYIQLTWCSNYKEASQALYGDDRLVKNPKLVETDENVAWATAFHYWGNRVHNFAGVQQGQFGSTTRAINGALECNGANVEQSKQRYTYYSAVFSSFGCSGAPNYAGCY